MYVTGSGNPLTVTALDAKTGRQIWRYTRQQPVKNPYENNRFNRGVAILDNRLFVGTLDAVLIALDARSGAVLWQVQMADTMEGYELTSPPLVVKDKVIMGMGGGEYAIRGFIDAYDAASGKRLWRFNTVPGPGEFGNDTWKGDSWQKGGGGAWLTPTFDPDLNLVYVPVGNPAPQLDRSVRGDGLDNLFSSSVVALDANTGLRKWHYQFTPNDGHDWDSTEDMILVDRMWKGQPRKLLLHADRNGFFYVLDRVTGEFLQATPFVYQNWNKGFDANGRPIVVPGANSSPEGHVPRLPDARRRHQLSAAVIQPGHGALLPPVRGVGPAVRQRTCGVRAGPAVHRPGAGPRARRLRAARMSRRRHRASRRSTWTPARRCGTSRSSRDR